VLAAITKKMKKRTRRGIGYLPLNLQAGKGALKLTFAANSCPSAKEVRK
jgi:hypothetical protein